MNIALSEEKMIDQIKSDINVALADLKPDINELDNEINKMKDYQLYIRKRCTQRLHDSSKGLNEEIQKTKNILDECSRIFTGRDIHFASPSQTSCKFSIFF